MTVEVDFLCEVFSARIFLGWFGWLVVLGDIAKLVASLRNNLVLRDSIVLRGEGFNSAGQTNQLNRNASRLPSGGRNTVRNFNEFYLSNILCNRLAQTPDNSQFLVHAVRPSC